MSTVQLPPTVRERIKGHVDEQQAIQAHVTELLATAVEALGHTSPILSYNVQTGEAILKDVSPNGVVTEIPALDKAVSG